jgi:16S rRNA (uracil1498-N3)-methyltransferase
MTNATRASTRLFVDAPLRGASLRLAEAQAHYLGRVLRCREGDRIVVFNSRGDERIASIKSLARRSPELTLRETLAALPESNARLILLQGLVKSDAMDLIVQKVTELGAHTLLAVKTDFSVIRLDPERKDRRLAHWRRIAVSACEQSGRHRPPELDIFDSLDSAIAALPEDASRIALHTDPSAPVDGADASGLTIAVAIGPEGGFSPTEVDRLACTGFRLRSLGPRTLRAETAAIAACASVQLLWGDLGRAQA